MMRYTSNPHVPKPARATSRGNEHLESWARANVSEMHLVFAILPSVVARMPATRAQVLIHEVKSLRDRIIADAEGQGVDLPVPLREKGPTR